MVQTVIYTVFAKCVASMSLINLLHVLLSKVNPFHEKSATMTQLISIGMMLSGDDAIQKLLKFSTYG
jgi:hypothetical protein